MFVRKVKRKTTRNIAVQIVRNDRTKEGKVRQKIVRHMDTAPEGPALDELLHVAECERLRIEEDRQPSPRIIHDDSESPGICAKD